jgi:hypothetical protein
MSQENAEEWIEADDDDDVIAPAKAKLKEALAWVATRNTAFVQIISLPFSSDLESSAKQAGIDMSFAGSAVEAWHLLRSTISSRRVTATGILSELPEDYLPGEPLPIRGQRIDLPADVAGDLDLILGRQMSLRPRKLEPAPKWWFKVEVRLDHLQESFPPPRVSRPRKKRNKGATQTEYAISFLKELDQQKYPVGVTLDRLAARISETGGPLKEGKYKISAKTVGRAADIVWPDGRSKKS